MSLKKVTIGIDDAVTSIVHPCFSALPGEFIHKKKKIVHAFFFPKIPHLMHPCYLGRMGAPENQVILLI